MKLAFVAALAVAGLAEASHAQEQFRAELDGAAVVPAVKTTARGYGRVRVDATTGHFDWEFFAIGFAPSEATIWGGPAGAESLWFSLPASGPHWLGSSANLTAAQLSELRAGHVYVQFHSSAHPSGEVRGAFHPSPDRFAALLESRQVVPPFSSSAVGSATFAIVTDRRVRYTVASTVPDTIGASVCVGDPGLIGVKLFDLQGANGRFEGVSRPISDDEFTLLQSGALYLQIDSNSAGSGALRGQIIAEGSAYGAPSGSIKGQCTLACHGAPTPGAAITLDIVGGRPRDLGILFVGTKPDGIRVGDADLLVCGAIAQLPVVLDRRGNRLAQELLPLLPPAVDGDEYYLQFIGSDPGKRHKRLYTSNAVEVIVELF